ncbi:conserved hypothetical protein [Listeria monocytogenes FSL F2-208]|nr:conserved hypothetical protein [Listeria monocytogenes FSL F2-208]
MPFYHLYLMLLSILSFSFIFIYLCVYFITKNVKVADKTIWNRWKISINNKNYLKNKEGLEQF